MSGLGSGCLARFRTEQTCCVGMLARGCSSMGRGRLVSGGPLMGTSMSGLASELQGLAACPVSSAPSPQP
jgi:hypothetical protein